jgi:pimeloyl-ACP methyl ester carboxylesterase
MQPNDFPDTAYTTTWSNGRGEVRFFTRPDGSRLRYYTPSTGPPLVLMHTVRTQLDYFQQVIPQLWDHYTIYALDLPGMGWSDIVPGARYEEPELRATVVEFANGLNLHGVTLAGESLGAALALSASIDLSDEILEATAASLGRMS